MFKLPLVTVVAMMVSSAVAAAEEGGRLTVRFSGLTEKTGEVLVSVADSKKMYDAADQAYLSARLAPDGKSVTAVFEAVPPGEYAVKVFHDANGNEKLDIGLMGPKEKYGFSNNVMGLMGPPDFADAAFRHGAEDTVIEIEAR